MTGYQEILSDPSYSGQLVVMTAAHIGNTGVNDFDPESWQPQAAGLIVRSYSDQYSSWRAQRSLSDLLREQGVVAISEVDTRAITRHIRSAGAMRGIIATHPSDLAALHRQVLAAPHMQGSDLTPRCYQCGAIWLERQQPAVAAASIGGDAGSRQWAAACGRL